MEAAAPVHTASCPCGMSDVGASYTIPSSTRMASSGAQGLVWGRWGRMLWSGLVAAMVGAALAVLLPSGSLPALYGGLMVCPLP